MFETIARMVNTKACGREYKQKGSRRMPGIVVFKTLAEALRAGYHVYDTTPRAYYVRIHTRAGWAIAIVERNGN